MSTDTDPLPPPPQPAPDADTAGFWEALARGRLELARCLDCRRWVHPPQERCRTCAGPLAFEPVRGDGRIFSFIVVRRQFVPGHPPPEVIALVELDEDPAVRLSAVLDADPAAVRIGARVRARIEAPTGAAVGAVFELVEAR